MQFFSKIILSLTIFTAVFTTAAPVFADQYGLDQAAGQAGLKGKGVAGGTSVESVVGNVVSIALSMIGIVFFLLILYAGFNWMIARGNAEAVDKSKAIIEGAVIGLIIVMAAYAITNFVFTSLDKGVATQGPTPSKLPCPAGSDTRCAGKIEGVSCGGSGPEVCKIDDFGDGAQTCGCVNP